MPSDNTIYPLKFPLAKRRLFIYLSLAIPSIIIFSCLPGFHPDRYVHTHYHIPGDLWVHVISYFFIGFLGFLLLSFKKQWVYANLILLFVFSVLLELIQILIPGRGFSWSDILFNFIGILFCAVVTSVYYILKSRKKEIQG